MRGPKARIVCSPGRRFGKLVILKRYTKYSSSRKPSSACLCKCDCGKTCEVWASQLRYENKDSCGCVPKPGQRHQCPPGDKYGRLIVLRSWVEVRSGRKRKITQCQCKCGEKVVVAASMLRSGKTKSCGCLRTRINKEHQCWKGFGDISGSVWNDIRRGAIRRSKTIPFRLTVRQAWKLFLKQGRKCAASGVAIDFPTRSRRFRVYGTASLDRIDSSKGYVISNVQWVHKIVNNMKQCLSQSDFLAWCKTIAEFNEQ